MLMPTPSKSHYKFNVRDFAHVIQGVLLSVPEATEGIDAMRRLWAHEIQRVYADRLTDVCDQKWLFQTICNVVEEKLHTTPTDLFNRFIESNDELIPENLSKLMYCDFTNPKADTRNYLEVQDIEELRYVVESYLVEFNNMTKRPMNLTIFRYAIEHISRVCRVLKQPRSHALLIGIGGSGRQSYTRLAAHIMDFELFQIELTRNYSIGNWNEFLKAMLLKISCTEAHGVFLFTDSQIKDIRFLDDISQLLRSGEILHLFSSDEIKEICDKMLAIDKQRDKSLQTDGSPKALYDLFIGIIREQLHIIICLSPVNKDFRNILRDYPSFVSACTVDWFHHWPDDDLTAISQRFLATDDFDLLTDAQQSSVTSIFKEFFSNAMSLVDEVHINCNQTIYLPPMTYIETINIFKAKLIKQKSELKNKERKYRISIERVIESNVQVTAMQKSIESLEPQCKIAAEKVAKQLSDVQLAQESVDEQREFVKKDETIVSEQSSTANDLSEHCKNIMEDFLPQMQEAEDAIQSLTPPDLTAVRTMKNPPIQVKLIMEAICILRDIKPEKVTVSLDDYWSLSKKMLNDPKYTEYLLTFEKDSIPDHITERIQEKILTNDAFDVEKIKLISVACEQLCKWVIAIAKYDRAAKIAQPKRIELKEAKTVRDASIAQLNTKVDELRLLEENLGDLQKQLQIEKNKYDELKGEHERCSKRLQRAMEIAASLDGEKNRWQQALDDAQTKSTTLIGDIIVSSAIVVYLGQFTESYRIKQIYIWIEKCSSFGICCNSYVL